jgi:hypothetical protein
LGPNSYHGLTALGSSISYNPNLGPITVTQSGPISFNAFYTVAVGAAVNVSDATTFVGTWTGQRYIVSFGGVINTFTRNARDVVPGSIAGMWQYGGNATGDTPPNADSAPYVAGDDTSILPRIAPVSIPFIYPRRRIVLPAT